MGLQRFIKPVVAPLEIHGVNVGDVEATNKPEKHIKYILSMRLVEF